jgi:hypothetical protein
MKIQWRTSLGGNKAEAVINKPKKKKRQSVGVDVIKHTEERM